METVTTNSSPIFSTDIPSGESDGVTSDMYKYYATTTAGYSNPHAPLYVASSTLTYDTNGNLTAYSTTSSYTWDYRNRITQIKSNVASSTAAATSTFNYNQDNQRTYQIVKATTTATSTTHYPNKYSSKVSSISGANTLATTTNYIYAGDTLIATIEQKLYNNVATGTPQTYFYHPDHLGSTNVVTSATGTILHTLDYYPYGAQRINRNITATKANRQYIGQFTDSATSLNYLQNRYLDNSRGQFMSQDPVFWEVGMTDDGKAVLMNPQAQNAYSYAVGNPIVNKDPQGRIIDTIADIGFIGYDLYDLGRAYAQGAHSSTLKQKAGYLGLDIAGAAIPGVTGLGIAARGAKVTVKATETVKRAEQTVGTINGTKKVEDGVIYLRTDNTGEITKPYVGQAKSEERYIQRQKEHQRANPNSSFNFNILDRGIFGKDLNSKEQFFISKYGGPTNKSFPVGGTSNKKNVIKQESNK